MSERLKYRIVVDEDVYHLQLRVNESIRDGWKPIGGISSLVQGRYREYAQAMIKVVDKNT